MQNRIVRLIVAWGFVILTTTAGGAAEFYVSPTGDDADPGSLNRPFATVQRAQQAARQRPQGEPVTVHLRDGTHYLAQTLVFTAEDSGVQRVPVVYAAYSQERPVISGGARLNLRWEPFRDGIVRAATPAGLMTDQLFVNGVRQPMARYPNFDPAVRHFNGYAADAFGSARAARWSDPRGGFIHAMHAHEWGDFHYLIAGKDPNNEVLYEGGWQNNRRMGMHNTYRMVENVFEELDAPGEWFHDAKAGVLYFYPPKELDLDKAVVEAVRLKHLVEFRGTRDKPVRFVSLQGLTFRHAARTFMENKEPLLRSDWTTYRGGAILFDGAEDCVIQDCTLDQLGGNGVFVNNYNRRITVRGCHIVGTGANGVAFVGDPNAVRNPLFEYNQRQHYRDIDKTPGPKNPDYPAGCLVEDCLIHETGRVEKQTAPVQISMSMGITVRHCSIYDVPRAGINISEGTFGGHVIEFCDVFDTVLETGDHGSFNSWGRDRYWGLEGIDLDTATLGADKDLPTLDLVQPNVLRNSRWRCDHGWDIDLDDGSSRYQIYNNLCLNGGLKLREGFYRHVENNIIVDNSFHPHVWYRNSQDVFRRNIVFTEYRPIRVNKPWGRECDFNLLHAPGQSNPAPATVLQQASGLDAGSLAADALFVDPARGDYRVKEGSTALKLGFVNFAMDRFGVQKPELKALARRPRLPSSAKETVESPSPRDSRVVEWLGAKVRNVVGMGEVSAAGLPGETGVLVLDAPAGSIAARSGLRQGDVILQCAGQQVGTLENLLRSHGGIPAGQKADLDVFRNQRHIVVSVVSVRVSLSPDGLRCEYAVNPLGVDAPAPRLCWKLQSDVRGQRQTAYQVQVASSRELLSQGQGDLWDSGKVVSQEATQIVYGGKPLRSSQQVFWRVRVWDKDDQPSDWSEPASWTMGVLAVADWRAKWIQHGTGEVAAGLPLLRKSFDLSGPATRAVVHVCGLGHYDLFLDGEKVGDRFLDPAWSVYEKTAYYSTFDITGSLDQTGPHVLSVMLGKGFYNTKGDRRVHGVTADRPLKLILQVRLWFADGREEFIVTDGSWKTQDGPITHSAILGGEDYDARKLPLGWDRSDFDDSAWSAAVETEGPGGQLVASYAPSMTMHEVFKAARIDEPEPGVFVYDFGQNASAVPQLRVRGKDGQVVKLTPAEQRHGMSPRRNDGRGLVNPAGVGTPNYWQYTLRGDAEERWTPQFAYSGYQYLQLEGAVPAGQPNPDDKPVVEELVSVHVRTDAPKAGVFECSDPLFNDIDRIVDWAVKSNMAHVLTDCPHREKLGWLEVSYLMGPSIAGRYDIASFYSKVTQDCADSQRADGLVPTVAPNYPVFAGGFAYTPEWGAAAVVLPWQVFEWYGDKQILAARYSTMKRFVDYMRDTSKDLVPAPGLGDWYDYGHDKPRGAAQFTPVELTAMATFFRCTRIVADSARILGYRDDSVAYDALAGDIARSFNAKYFDGRDQYANMGSPQTANSMALTLGLVPTDFEQAVLERIVQDIRGRGNQQTAGDIGFWYLLQALARNGRSDVIYDMVARTDIGSYGFIVRNGWTSMPEAWDADTGASMNHCMLGHIQEWFLGWVAGIRPDVESPGFRRFFIEPNPVGGLTWARAKYDSLRGEIVSDWRKSDDAFTLRVTVPAGTVATVSIPAAEGSKIAERGVPAWQAPGVHLAGRQSSRVQFLVESGVYEFTARP
jgi:hypothetical protein